jgi:hypothetical protein
MSTMYYFKKDDKDFGPYTIEMIQTFIDNGQLTADDLISVDNQITWVIAKENQELSSMLNPEESLEHHNIWDNEQLIGIVPQILKKEGLIKRVSYNIIITDKRLLFSKITKAMIKEDQAALIEETKGKGFMARMGAVMGSNQRLYNRYQQLTPEEILNENQENYSLEHQQVDSVKFRYSMTYDDSGQSGADKFIIKSVLGKHEFSFSNNGDTSHAKKMLKTALGSKVK